MNILTFLFLTFSQLCCTPNVYSQPPFETNQLITFLQRPVGDSIRLVSKNAKYGIIDSSGQVTVPLIYNEISLNFSIREELLFQKKYLNELFYFYWEDGNESEELYAQLLAQELNDSTSYLSLSNKFRADPLFAAKKNDTWGVVNKSNDIVVPFIYSYLQEIGQDIYLAKKEGKYGVIDSEDNILIPIICDTILTFFSCPNSTDTDFEIGAYAISQTENKFGAINLFTKKVIPQKYDNIEQCFQIPEYDCSCIFLPDTDWRIYTPERKYRVHRFQNVLRYRIGNKYGLLNLPKMIEVSPALYDSIGFEYPKGWNIDKAIVKLNSKYSILTHENSNLHPILYDSINVLFNRYRYRYDYNSTYFYKVDRNGFKGVLDHNGREVLRLEWNNIMSGHQLSDSLTYEFIVKQNGKFGVVNSNQEVKIAVKYDSVSLKYNDGYYYLLEKRGRLKTVQLD